MASVDTDKIMSANQVAEASGLSYATMLGVIKAYSITPVFQGGRTKLYDVDDIKDALYEKDRKFLEFMGYRPVSESYDNVITSDATASDDQE